MRDRVILGLSAALLLLGLAVWTLQSRDAGLDEERRRYVETLRAPPPLGTDLHPADPRGTSAADAFRRAGLGDAPLRFFFTRGETAIVGAGVEGRDALEVWSALRAVAGETHLFPVILGDGFSVERHADAVLHTSTPVEATLSRASALDLDAWLAARPEPVAGNAMPVAPREERFLSVVDPVLGVPVMPVAVALFPVARAADVPAWLAFGNWHDCPEAAVHVAVLRRLEDEAHVELVAITSDRIELRIPSPPSDPAVRDHLATILARWDVAAFRADRATIASWSATLVPSRSWSLSFPRPR